jgi:serine/threonine-protein kinase
LSLGPGDRVGSCEIVALIGAGGMGEVYRARDTTLEREVALKVLPETFATDPDRLARFQREAKVLASLNHPHIAAIYGLADAGNTHALILELVEGPTLADRIARGPLPVDEAIAVAKQIAEALEAAHERGIIHRDLKPANIKVRDDGTVKVLDFGLAKAMEPASAISPMLTNSPTITTPAMVTGVGTLLGTAAYMSPEQAKGRPADKRSDVWAFGCVLFEMLTGKRAFEGEDVSDTLAAVLRAEPQWIGFPSNTPVAVRTLVRHCLEKDRRHRISDISTPRFILHDPSIGGSAISVESRRPPLRRRLVPILIGMIAVAALTGGVVWRMTRGATAVPSVTRFQITLDGQVSTAGSFAAISPDGTKIVYATDRLYVRSLSELAARPIAGTEHVGGLIGTPVFSADGRSIAFWFGPDPTKGELKKVAVDGGPVLTIASASYPFGMTWGREGIVFGQIAGSPRGIVRVSPNGGKPELLVGAKPDEFAIEPQILPGEDAVLFTYASGLNAAIPSATTWDKAQVVVQSLRTGARSIVVDGGSAGRYIPSGHLVYAVGGTLLAAPFDLTRRQSTGPAIPVVERVVRAVAGTFALGSALFSVSDTGSLVYVAGDRSITQVGTARGLLARTNRKGETEALKLPEAAYEFPRVSPDGTRLAYDTVEGDETVVWVYELSGAVAPIRLTFGGHNRFPIWTPDGQRITFQSDREGDSGIFWQRADGTGIAERLTKAGMLRHVPLTWSPRGDVLVFATAGGQSSLQTLSLADKKIEPFGHVEASTIVTPTASFSPDGRWLAYSLPNASGPTSVVFVQPFPSTGAKYQISEGPGTGPVWSRDGREMFFVSFSSTQPRLFSARVTTSPAFSFTSPTIVEWPGDVGANTIDGRQYDIQPDGQHFIRLVAAGDRPSSGPPPNPPIQVVLNWFEELKQRVPAK